MADPNHLCRPQLRELVERLAADEGRWRHLVRHAPDRRVYEELLLQEDESPAAVGVWLICWMNDQDTGYHDHDVSSGAVAIARGEVVDERMTLGSRPRARLYSAGQSF